MGHQDEIMMFSSRNLWYEIGIHPDKITKIVCQKIGKNEKELRERETSIEYLSKLMEEIKTRMKYRINRSDSKKFIHLLMKLFQRVYSIYIKEKELRIELKRKNIRDGGALEQLEINKQIGKNLIDGITVWIENAVLLENMTNGYEKFNEEYIAELLVDLLLYSFSSQAYSLLLVSKIKNFTPKEYFYGLDIKPNDEIPIQPYRLHPVTYDNHIISGNQSFLYDDIELKNADDSDIGREFKKKYGNSFLRYIGVLHLLEEYGINEVLSKSEFISRIGYMGIDELDSNKIYNNMTISIKNLQNNLGKNEEVLYKIESDENRLSLKPFIKLISGNILTNAQLISRAKQVWVSYYLNGGQPYSVKPIDNLLKAFQTRNDELADRLVEKLRTKLRKKYNNVDFDEIEVNYARIFGGKPINYGDFDLVFYTKDSNELFLIEAKYICDSLNANNIVSDYDKIYREKGYHFKCRRRYDLVIREKEKLKSFLKIEGDINVHFLFVSSKPLELDLQDDSGIVTFLSLELFESYIDGKYESENGGEVVRPIYKL